MNNHFRTLTTHEQYQRYKASRGRDEGCPLCAKDSLVTYNYWRIVDNSFPYDRVASKHTQLIPKRHVTEGELNEAEKQELLKIKASNDMNEYEFFLESVPKNRSIPAHYHVHLIQALSE